jgi:hypothetical protein
MNKKNKTEAVRIEEITKAIQQMREQAQQQATTNNYFLTTKTSGSFSNWTYDQKEAQKAREYEREKQNQLFMLEIEQMLQAEKDGHPCMCPQCENSVFKGKKTCKICCGLGVAPIPVTETKHKIGAY